MASLVPRGLRAFAVPTSLPRGAAVPGDRVDILATYASGQPHSEMVVEGVTEGRGEPILNPVTKAEHRVRIDMVDGFEYTLAEIGRGWTKVSQPIAFELADSYAQFAEIHLCQDGILR